MPAEPEPPYLLWGITTTGEPQHDTCPTALHAHVRKLFSAWSNGMRDLLDAADTTSITAFPYLAADPEIELTPWSAGPITALGDAVHAMPPTGGRGAITAIRDADQLATRISAVEQGIDTLPRAVHSYQRHLPTYATEALRESLRPLLWQRRLAAAPGIYRVARVLLPLVDGARRPRTGSVSGLFR